MRGALELLAAAYAFDAVESAGLLKFKKRGRSPSRVLTESDLVPLNAEGYIVGTYDKDAGPNNQRLYLNGARVAQMSDTAAVSLNSNPLGIGRHASGVADPFNGYIDEFRISHIQRSDGWIATTYNNMSNPGAFAMAGAEEQSGGGGEPPPVSSSASLGEGEGRACPLRRLWSPPPDADRSIAGAGSSSAARRSVRTCRSSATSAPPWSPAGAPTPLGEVDRAGRISKQGDALLRGYLYEAATVLISGFGPPTTVMLALRAPKEP